MKKKIFVGNLSWKVSEESLRPVFEAYGPVVSCKIITDQYTGKSKGFGFIEFGDGAQVEKAIQELDGKPLMERNMRVSLAQERTERPAGGGGGHRDRDRGGDREGARGGYRGNH